MIVVMIVQARYTSLLERRLGHLDRGRRGNRLLLDNGLGHWLRSLCSGRRQGLLGAHILTANL